MNPEMKIIREVNIQAEFFYSDAVKLGNHAAYALKAPHRSQMTGLENIAESTFKTSDVFDYVKKQTARFQYWRQTFSESDNPQQGFGEQLTIYLQEKLTSKVDGICKKLGISDTWERRRIHLLLIRQFIRQMVVHYEYQVSIGNRKGA